ncbi:MAG: hypothetical protein ABI978_01785 [Chloroflexota bacterium]
MGSGAVGGEITIEAATLLVGVVAVAEVRAFALGQIGHREEPWLLREELETPGSPGVQHYGRGRQLGR